MKEKPFKKVIPRLYKRSAEDKLMYGYVLGMQRALPSVNTMKCITMFLKDFELEEDDYPLESAYTTFKRLKAEHDVL